jgi:acetyltransferase-like isoleucine patch superfamily enzyme
LLRRMSNRFFHLLARFLPGSTSVRPFLHRVRGAKIGKNVFIGDDVYLENEHPEAVEIQDGVQISVRSTILAHTRGAGRVIIEKDAFIGPNTVIVTSGDKILRIGEGAVIGAGVVVTQDIPAHLFVACAAAIPVANALVPLTKAEKMDEFVRGLVPIARRPKAKAPEAVAVASKPASSGRG